MRGRIPGGAGLFLIPAAALVVHQLRYTLAYGSKANAELAAQGHSYLHSLVPWLVLVVGVGVSAFVRRTAHALRTGETGTFSRRSAAALWLGTTLSLTAIYAIQEFLEELFASGHPTGLTGIFGHGGWWSLAAAALVAALVVAILRLGRSILRAAAMFAARRRRQASLPALIRPADVLRVAARPLALSAAGRAPPRSSLAG